MTTFTKRTENAVKKEIVSAREQGEKLDALIVDLAQQVFAHLEDNGNSNLASDLVHAMPKISRKKALIVWIEDFSPYEYDDKDKVFRKTSETPFNRQGAFAKPFFDYKPEIVRGDFTLEKFILEISKRVVQAEKTATANLDNASEKQLEELRKMQELATQLQNLPDIKIGAALARAKASRKDKVKAA